MKGTEPQPACSRHTTAVKKKFSDQVDAIPLKNGDATTRWGGEGGKNEMVSGADRQKGLTGAARRDPLSFGHGNRPRGGQRRRLRSWCIAARATWAGTIGTPAGILRGSRTEGANRENSLRPGQQQTEQNGQPNSHDII